MSRRIVLGGALVWLVALAPSRPSAEPAAPERTPRRLALRPASAALRGADSPPTPAWGFDGAVPGPVLKVRRGGEVWVTAANELPGPTAIHWHGLRIDNRMDGVPHLTQPPIAPGASFDYRFTCPDAGTFWYHTNSVEQLGRGLAGALIVEEDTAPAADHDLVLLLQDWLITAAGALDSTVAEPGTAGRVGSLATLNGQPGQDVAVKASDRVRLRLINATTARIAALTFEGGLKPVVVAVDGQPAEVFELGRPTLALPPGARVDVMVDMPAAATDASPPAIRLRGYGTDAVLARFVIDPGPPRRPDPLGKVAELPANPLPRTIELTGALRAELVMDGGGQESALAPAKEPTRERPPTAAKDSAAKDKEPPKTTVARPPAWALSAQSGEVGPPLFSVPRGRTVVLALVNRTRRPHVVHIHGHHVRLLDSLDDGWKPWWHDTLLVGDDRTARIAFVADNPGKWLLECRMLDQQATSMATWFEVT
ncbi:multicopper oxidase [Blastochloris viridis]|nr:multicopper oxidase [Blastochloris viridis]